MEGEIKEKGSADCVSDVFEFALPFSDNWTQNAEFWSDTQPLGRPRGKLEEWISSLAQPRLHREFFRVTHSAQF